MQTPPPMHYLYRILSLLPAQPDTFAIYSRAPDEPSCQTDLVELSYEPVVGWALAECWYVEKLGPYHKNDLPHGSGRRAVVPLVVNIDGEAEPVDRASTDFIGIRIGKYFNSYLHRGWADEDRHDPYSLWDCKNDKWVPRQFARERAQKRELLRKEFLFLMHKESDRLGMLVGADIGSVVDRLALLAVPEPTTEAPQGADHG